MHGLITSSVEGNESLDADTRSGSLYQSDPLRNRNYFFSVGVGAEGVLDSPSFNAPLKFLMPSPRPLPKSASLPGPKNRSAMPNNSNNSVTPSFPPNILNLQREVQE